MLYRLIWYVKVSKSKFLQNKHHLYIVRYAHYSVDITEPTAQIKIHGDLSQKNGQLYLK